MKSDAERGPIGAWAYRERKRRGWSDEEAVRFLEQITGTRLRAVSLRGIEAGPKPPSAEVIASLERLYESKAPEPKAPVTMADLVAALHSNTEAMREVIGVLRESALAGASRGVAAGQARYEAELRDRSVDAAPDESQPPSPQRSPPDERP